MLYNVYSSPNVTTIMKLRKIGWVENVVWMGFLEMFSALQSENMKRRDNL
jgi:hypothetical protein